MKGWGLWLALSALAWAGPQHDAAVRGDTTALRQFSKAEINQPDAKGLTPLVLAIQAQHPECVPVLLELGANPNQGNWSALHEAAVLGDLESAQALLKAGADPNRREAQNQGTPLHVACFQGHLEICRLLLNRGAQVNLRDGEGLTPLFHAKDQAHPKIVELLRSLGGR